MRKRVFLLVSLAVGLLLATGLQPAQAQGTDPYWWASYWNNMTLSGPPVLQRQEAVLNYDWGLGSPAPAVQAEHFSARWSRYIEVVASTYRFTASNDDGMRVWVDGELIIDKWYDQVAFPTTVDKWLGAGRHFVVVDFYENTGLASASLSWAPTPSPTAAWRAEYFNNKTLSGTPALVRDEAQLAFDWGTGSPAPGVIAADGFSARWTRTLYLPAGVYHFYMTVDDGGRLWVNGYLLIDIWRDQPPSTYTGEMYLPGEPVSVKMEHYENAGIAVAQLSWRSISGPNEVVVDDTDPGFVKGGAPGGWRIVYEGYNGRLIWTRNNDRAWPNYNWARWYPNLVPGRYEVSVFIPERYTTTAQARYWISHANGFTLRVVDQSANGNRWVSLGTYWFRGTSQDYVSLADVTYEPRLTRLIAFDAAKWEPR